MTNLSKFAAATMAVAATTLTLLSMPHVARAQTNLPVAPVAPFSRRAAYGTTRANRAARASRTAAKKNNRTTRTNANTAAGTRKHKLDLTEALNQLNLTPAQRSQINGLQNKSNEDGRAIYNDHTLTGQQVIDKMNTVNQGMIGNVKAVLTPEQKTKLESIYPEAKGI